MIKTESEYQECLKRLRQDLEHIATQRNVLKEHGLNEEQIERALEPSLAFHEQLKEEVEWYERVKRRDFGVIRNLTALGPLLVALRIANGITQTELARRLDVDDSQISRDERNEYHGVTLERAQRVLEALQENVIAQVEEKGFCRDDELVTV